MRRLLAAATIVPCLVSTCARAQQTEPKGMPQLDFGNPFTISQVVWLAVIFVVLYVALSRWALPKVGRVLDDRATRIASDLNSARAAKAEADAAMQDARNAAHHAHAQAQSEISAAVERARAESAAEAATLTASLDARLAQSEQAIAEARTRAMAGLASIAASVAASLVERLSGRPADYGAVNAAIISLLDQRTA